MQQIGIQNIGVKVHIVISMHKYTSWILFNKKQMFWHICRCLLQCIFSASEEDTCISAETFALIEKVFGECNQMYNN